jgi:hypothetical protein
VVARHVVSDRYQLWPPGQEIVPADMWLGLAMHTETAATCTHVVQFGHCGSFISWCEFHPLTAMASFARTRAVGRARTYNGDHSCSIHDSKSRSPISECVSPRRYFRGRKGPRRGPVRKVHRGASQTGLGGARRRHSVGRRAATRGSTGRAPPQLQTVPRTVWVRCARRPTIQLRAAGV